MKKTAAFFAFFLLTLVFAQDKTYTTSMDSLLSHVDKSTMTTGILYDRIFPISDLEANITAAITLLPREILDSAQPILGSDHTVL